MTYEDIKKANESISPVILERKDKKTGKITKNEYATVAQRIKAFRMVYPAGFIVTNLKTLDAGVCIFTASVGYYDDDGTSVVIGTGTAYEKEGSSFINNTSFIENAETSAVGRALGMSGFGVLDDVASAEEVQNAVLNNTAKEKIDEVQARALENRCKASGVDVGKLCKLYKVKQLSDLTQRQHANIHEHWDKISLGEGD